MIKENNDIKKLKNIIPLPVLSEEKPTLKEEYLYIDKLVQYIINSDVIITEIEEPDVSRTTADVNRTTADVSRATADISRTTADVSRTTADVSRTTADVSRTTADVSITTADVSRTTADVSRTTTELNLNDENGIEYVEISV
jgi:hypothetical protein